MLTLTLKRAAKLLNPDPDLLHRFRALVPFLRRHGPDLFAEVRAAYVDTLSRVLSSHFRAYLAALDAATVQPRATLPPCALA